MTLFAVQSTLNVHKPVSPFHRLPRRPGDPLKYPFVTVRSFLNSDLHFLVGYDDKGLATPNPCRAIAFHS